VARVRHDGAVAKTRYASDPGLTSRMLMTMGGLGLLYVIIAAVLISIGMDAVFVLALSAGGLWAQWYFSDTIALRAMRAVEVGPEQAPQLHGIIDRLCALADMPKPRVAIADTDVPNAFATGRSPNRSAVCVTTGLLRRLDREELEAVLAHELSHVAHRDVTVMTVASFSAIVAGIVMRSAMWGGIGRDRRDQNGALVFLAVLAVSVLVYFVSFLLTRALSRYRELSADRGGSLLTGNPAGLARALQKISGDMARIPTADLRAMEPVNAFAIAPAVNGQRGGGVDLSSLFATHPSLDKRLQNLARIANELGT
jgi:heat shock protein HtpX